jgi:hypothetical protein
MSEIQSKEVSPSGFSHSFDTGIAAILGLHAAIVYNHIVYWLRINASKNHNFVDGKIWMYETQEDIAEFLEYLSIDQVKKAILKLLESGLLIKDCHNKNKFNRTAWYTVRDQNILGIKKILTKVPIGTMHSANSHDGQCDAASSLYIQQEHLQEEQQTTQEASPPETPSLPAAVVVSSEKEEQKAKLLKEVGFDSESIQDISKQYDLERIKIALETLKQAQECKDIPNPCGFVVSALKREWKPNATETSVLEEKRRDEEEKRNIAIEKKAEANELFNLYREKFNNDFAFHVRDEGIHVKIKMRFAILYYSETSCIENLKKTIEENLKCTS